MPAPVRRPRRFFLCFSLLALALAPAALAGNGGLAPPDPASPSASHIRDIYWLILAMTGAIFLLVVVTLIVFLVRYRSRGRPRDVEGAQVRGHTNLELAWTAGPVVLLAVIAGFVFWKVSDLSATASSGAKVEITIDAHQYYWEFVYPNGAVSVDHLRLPLDKPVRLTIVSHDVDHSWWVPALGGKVDAIPGRTNHLTLRPTKLGTFYNVTGFTHIARPFGAMEWRTDPAMTGAVVQAVHGRKPLGVQKGERQEKRDKQDGPQQRARRRM